jgi:hypothetical protein
MVRLSLVSGSAYMSTRRVALRSIIEGAAISAIENLPQINGR